MARTAAAAAAVPRSALLKLLVFLPVGLALLAVGRLSGPAATGDLIAVQIPASSEPEIPATGLRLPLDRLVDGARIVRITAVGGSAINLTPEFVGAVDPDISFDGRWIVFSGKRNAEDPWEIWRMDLDGSNKRQISRGPGDKIDPVFAGSRFFLDDPQPTPQIIYAGNGHGWRNELGEGASFALYGTDHEGAAVHRLTFNLQSDFAPELLPDGRLVYTSWQARGEAVEPEGRFALMGVNLDGTDGMGYVANRTGVRYMNLAGVAPEGERVYFVESDGMGWLGAGDLAFVSRHRPMSTYRKLTSDGRGRYHSPRPLADGTVLISYRVSRPGSVFEVYRLDAETGARKGSVFGERGWHTIDSRPIRTRSVPPGRGNWLIPGSTTGVFYCLASHVTNLPNLRAVSPGEIQFVRVIEGVGAGSMDPDAAALRRLLGVAPVEPDGSFHVRVPAHTPITFQLLNEEQVAIRTQGAWTWVIGNENRGCIGCHEDPELSPPNRLVDAIAKPAVELTPPPEARRTVDFVHDVAPILAARCASGACHPVSAPDNGPGPATPDREDAPPALTYAALLADQEGDRPGRLVIPGRAIDSPLLQVLEREPDASGRMPPHAPLSPDERLRIIEWIDLGAARETRPDRVPNPASQAH